MLHLEKNVITAATMLAASLLGAWILFSGMRALYDSHDEMRAQEEDEWWRRKMEELELRTGRPVPAATTLKLTPAELAAALRKHGGPVVVGRKITENHQRKK